MALDDAVVMRILGVAAVLLAAISGQARAEHHGFTVAGLPTAASPT